MAGYTSAASSYANPSDEPHLSNYVPWGGDSDLINEVATHAGSSSQQRSRPCPSRTSSRNLVMGQECLSITKEWYLQEGELLLFQMSGQGANGCNFSVERAAPAQGASAGGHMLGDIPEDSGNGHGICIVNGNIRGSDAGQQQNHLPDDHTMTRGKRQTAMTTSRKKQSGFKKLLGNFGKKKVLVEPRTEATTNQSSNAEGK
jgi:hypothetical protein